MDKNLQAIAEKLKSAQSVAIFTHMRPDGDAIGGTLALSRALDSLGIENETLVESDIPSNLCFLDGVQKMQKQLLPHKR